MRTANRRFEKLSSRLGFNVLHGKQFRDIDEVVYRRLKLFSVPSRMNSWPNELYSWHGMMLPNYHDLEMKARWYKFVQVNPNWYQETLKEYANQKFNPQEYEVSQ